MCRLFLIQLDFYPYYRLPSTGEVDLFTKEIQNRYNEAKNSDLLKPMLWTQIFFKMKDINRSMTSIDMPIKGAPKKLTSDIFDTNTGIIKYHQIFQENIFNHERDIASNKIKDFCLDQNKTYITYEKSQIAIDNLLMKLNMVYSKHDTEVCVGGVNFIHSLEYMLRRII